MRTLHGARRRERGFTLAEVAVTILIIGIALTINLQILNGAKLLAAHTTYVKLARERALQTLGEIEAGLYWDDIRSGMIVYYDEEELMAEVRLGDDAFYEPTGDEPFDNFAYREELERQSEGYDDDEEGEAQSEWEKVRIRVAFPNIDEMTSELVLERWIPWNQVYPEEENGESTEDVIDG